MNKLLMTPGPTNVPERVIKKLVKGCFIIELQNTVKYLEN